MTLNELDSYFKTLLKIEDFTNDVSVNGIQIQNSSPDTKQIKKVYFAVDACEQTALKAAELGADVLFVHHGLFWPHGEVLTGAAYKRVSAFVKNDLALYACHIPLDANNPYGNNYGLAARIGLEDVTPFASWRGMILGVKGKLKNPVSIEQLASLALKDGEKPLKILPFGKERISTVGIVSGGAAEDVEQAIELGLDAFITGEIEHQLYHYIKESGINFLALGHYNTETVGVSLLAEKLAKDTGIETRFIDFTTGL